MTAPSLLLPRSGRVCAWGSAALRGQLAWDVAAAGCVGDDALHRIVGVPGETGPVGWSVALGRLRASGVRGLAVALPVPGDPAGVPGPPAFVQLAVEAGEVVLTRGGGPGPDTPTSFGLLPSVSSLAEGGAVVRWDVHVVDGLPHAGLPSLAEADRTLTESLLVAASELESLGLQRDRADLAVRLREFDRAAERLVLPPGMAPRALRVLRSATRLAGIVALARQDDGAAVSAAEADRRIAVLNPLAAAARTAVAVAFAAEPD